MRRAPKREAAPTKVMSETQTTPTLSQLGEMRAADLNSLLDHLLHGSCYDEETGFVRHPKNYAGDANLVAEVRNGLNEEQQLRYVLKLACVVKAELSNLLKTLWLIAKASPSEITIALILTLTP
jgi:hypothetical protein